MHFKYSAAAFLALFFVLFEQNAVEAVTCEEFVFEMMVEQTKLVVPCLKKLGYKTGHERKEHVNCVMKCMFIESKFIEDDGTVDMDKAQKLFETKVPAELREKASAALAQCGAHAVGLDGKEPKCDSYGPLADCIIDFGSKMCT